jgi:hypothetical protein
MKTVKEAAEALGLTQWAIYKAIENQTEMGTKFVQDERLGRYMINARALKALVKRRG